MVLDLFICKIYHITVLNFKHNEKIPAPQLVKNCHEVLKFLHNSS